MKNKYFRWTDKWNWRNKPTTSNLCTSKTGANGYFKIYAIIDELGSYAFFTRVGNEKSGLGDYE
jgi:hypothetical protein